MALCKEAAAAAENTATAGAGAGAGASGASAGPDAVDRTGASVYYRPVIPHTSPATTSPQSPPIIQMSPPIISSPRSDQKLSSQGMTLPCSSNIP